MQSKPLALAPFFVAVYLALTPANASTLTGYLSDETGPENAIELTIAVTNPDVIAANNAAISSFTLTQTAGGAATPIIGTTFPLSLGTIAPGATAFGVVTVDFTGADLSTALFRMNVTLAADGFTGGFEFDDLPPQNPCPNNLAACPFPPLPIPTPLPSTLPLLASGIAALGVLGWHRKRKAAAIAA